MELKERVVNAGRYLNAKSGEDAVTIANVAEKMKVPVADIHKLFPNDKLLLSQVQGNLIS